MHASDSLTIAIQQRFQGVSRQVEGAVVSPTLRPGILKDEGRSGILDAITEISVSAPATTFQINVEKVVGGHIIERAEPSGSHDTGAFGENKRFYVFYRSRVHPGFG